VKTLSILDCRLAIDQKFPVPGRSVFAFDLQLIYQIGNRQLAIGNHRPS